MGRFDVGIAVAVPPLTRISEPSNLTLANLIDTGHPVNDSSRSGKGKNMAINIDGDVWVAQGSAQAAPWRRIQWKTDYLQSIFRLDSPADNTISSLGYQVLDGSTSPVEDFFQGSWQQDLDKLSFTYTGEKEAIYKFVVSGQIPSDLDSARSDTIGVGIFDVGSGVFLTGTNKVMPAVRLKGVTGSIVSFTLMGYARVNNGDIFEIKAISSEDTDATVESLLVSIEPLDALLYL